MEYYLHIDVSKLDDYTLAAKFEIINKLRNLEKDNSLNEIQNLLKLK